MAAELIQIYYKDEHLKELLPIAKPYFNAELTIFFENSVIQKLVMETKAEKIGVISWKLKQKLRYNIGKPTSLDHITEEVINSEYAVLPFTRNSVHHKTLEALEFWHNGSLSLLTKILDRLGIKMPSEVWPAIYQNAFMAKTEIYQDYVSTYLSPAMALIKNDPEIYKLATVNSNYTNLNKQDAAKPEYLQEKIGMPYYPLSTFILERLFSVYVHNKKINVTFIQ